MNRKTYYEELIIKFLEIGTYVDVQQVLGLKWTLHGGFFTLFGTFKVEVGIGVLFDNTSFYKKYLEY